MKNQLLTISIVILLCMFFVGCSENDEAASKEENVEKVTLSMTINCKKNPIHRFGLTVDLVNEDDGESVESYYVEYGKSDSRELYIVPGTYTLDLRDLPVSNDDMSSEKREYKFTITEDSSISFDMKPRFLDMEILNMKSNMDISEISL